MEEKVRRARKKSLLWAFIGGASLLAVYFIIVSVANSFHHAVQEFTQLWYWIGGLVVGFAIQVGLYMHVRQTLRIKEQARGISSAVAAGGGLSTVSMIACCAHHLTDFLPILGLSAAALFLTDYQLAFMWIGIISNVIGITYMLSIIARHRLYFEPNRWLARLAALNYRRIFRIEIPALLGLFILGVFFLPEAPEASSASAEPVGPVVLETREAAGNGIWVDVNGQYDAGRGVLTFAIRFTTHSGSLDFKVDEVAELEINGQRLSVPVSWVGSPPGGHHRSGTLTFEDVSGEVRSIRLKLAAPGRLGVREFAWEL